MGLVVVVGYSNSPSTSPTDADAASLFRANSVRAHTLSDREIVVLSGMELENGLVNALLSNVPMYTCMELYFAFDRCCPVYLVSSGVLLIGIGIFNATVGEKEGVTQKA
ncbi:hypothetical protein QAD02_000887 [Eretmocerus hayati]|uniref:Uncharacterized protein n=1 Tax=Eretmocerus hayati TaxID=131215 RepID=A0ACC2NFB7_9HYME|nr:hypothetical protein QAD02_000887 [Eretmocerus hayati]